MGEACIELGETESLRRANGRAPSADELEGRVLFLWCVILLAVGAACILLARRILWAVTITGHSMEPSLHDGDLVVATRWWSPSLMKRGDMVLVRGFASAEPTPTSMMVKRISQLPGDHVRWVSWLGPDPGSLERHPDPHEKVLDPGEIFVLADNETGIDSRTLGPIPIKAVSAVVLWRPRYRVGRHATSERP